MTIDLIQAAAQTYFGGGSVDNVEALRLKTGSGNDRLTGAANGLVDTIDTGDGNDRIVLPMSQNDTVHGGAGRDVLVVNSSVGGASMTVSGDLAGGYSGFFNGNDPNNLNFTGIEDFSFTGTGTDPDHITTGDGKDTLIGAGGDDILTSGGGVDVIDGGDGQDLWVADKSFAAFALKINLSKPGAQEHLTGGSVVNVEGMQLKSGSGDDKLQGMNSFLVDSIDGGAGEDVIGIAMSNTDTVNGGDGEDELNVVQTNGGGVSLSVTGDLASGYSGPSTGPTPTTSSSPGSRTSATPTTSAPSTTSRPATVGTR